MVGRIRETRQPRGGYIHPRAMEAIQLGDGGTQPVNHKLENVRPATVGSAVDYLSRLANGTEPGDAFRIPILGTIELHYGALISNGLDVERLSRWVDVDYLRGEPSVEQMEHLSDALARLEALRPGVIPEDDAICAAVHLVGYDVAKRDPDFYEGKHAVPDAVTIAHIRTMVERAVAFFAEYGPVTEDGFRPVNVLSRTELVDSGDGDFLTADTLWDFKVSVSPPTKDHTLQLFMYLIMGQRSGQEQFEQIMHLGIFNPRLNTVYQIALDEVPPEVVREVSSDVIGYAYA